MLLPSKLCTPESPHSPKIRSCLHHRIQKYTRLSFLLVFPRGLLKGPSIGDGALDLRSSNLWGSLSMLQKGAKAGTKFFPHWGLFQLTSLIPGVTILLSLTVFLNMVSATMPVTSDNPLLGKHQKSGFGGKIGGEFACSVCVCVRAH